MPTSNRLVRFGLIGAAGLVAIRVLGGRAQPSTPGADGAVSVDADLSERSIAADAPSDFEQHPTTGDDLRSDRVTVTDEDGRRTIEVEEKEKDASDSSRSTSGDGILPTRANVTTEPTDAARRGRGGVTEASLDDVTESRPARSRSDERGSSTSDDDDTSTSRRATSGSILGARVHELRDQDDDDDEKTSSNLSDRVNRQIARGVP